MARDIRDDERMAEWASVAPDYRSRWEAEYGTTGRWEDFEPAYRYGYKMACDPRSSDSTSIQVRPRYRGGYGTWATRCGYRYDENAWGRLKRSIREAWDRVTVRR